MSRASRKIDASRSKTIFFCLYPEPSAYNGSLELSRRLRERGWRVVYMTTDRFSQQLANMGLENVEIRLYTSADEARAKELLARLKGPAKGLVKALYLRSNWLRKSLLLVLSHRRIRKEMGRWLAANSPALAVLDPLVTAYSLPLVEFGLPILNLTSELTACRSASVPPVFSGLTTDERKSRLGRWRILLSWKKLELFQMLQETGQALAWLSAGLAGIRERPPHEALKGSGAPLCRDEYGLRLKVADMVMCPAEFDFPAATANRAERCYVGACVSVERKKVPFDWDRIDPERPFVYCSLGTYSSQYRHSRRLILAAIDAFRERPEWQLLLQAGDAVEAERLEPLPRNVILAGWVPQILVLQKASLYITHGGLSSVREAIYFGVPMIVFPCRMDQAGNAARVVYHGLGLSGEIGRVTSRTLAGLLDQLASEGRFRQSVQRMQRIIREQRSCESGADFIERAISERLS